MKIPAINRQLAAALYFAALLCLAACSKSNDKSNQTEQQSLSQGALEGEAEGEILYDDVFNNVMGTDPSVAIGGTGVFGSKKTTQPGTMGILSAPCYTVSFQFLAAPATFPVRVTIDFGTGCTGDDRRTHKGKIISVYTGHLLVAGSVAETGFDNYYVNDIKVEETHRIENKSGSGGLVFETKVTDGKLTRANGDFVNWTRTRLISQTEGWTTPAIPADDVFTIAGNGAGTVHRGNHEASWTSINLEPLVKRFNCRWIVKGKQAIQRNDGPQGILDFGNGDCDNKATITVNGVSVEITLK